MNSDHCSHSALVGDHGVVLCASEQKQPLLPAVRAPDVLPPGLQTSGGRCQNATLLVIGTTLHDKRLSKSYTHYCYTSPQNDHTCENVFTSRQDSVSPGVEWSSGRRGARSVAAARPHLQAAGGAARSARLAAAQASAEAPGGHTRKVGYF